MKTIIDNSVLSIPILQQQLQQSITSFFFFHTLYCFNLSALRRRSLGRNGFFLLNFAASFLYLRAFQCSTKLIALVIRWSRNKSFPFEYLKFKIHVHHILGRKMIRADYYNTILRRKRLRCQTNDSYHNIFLLLSYAVLF